MMIADKDWKAVSDRRKAVCECSPTPSTDTPSVDHSTNSFEPELLGFSPVSSRSASPSIAGPGAGGASVAHSLLGKEDEKMAAPRRELLHKDHFAFVFGSVKTQHYFDPASKGPGSHT